MKKISSFIRKCVNLILYYKFVDCKHQWRPEGFIDEKCLRCGSQR